MQVIRLNTNTQFTYSGRWITERQYAELHGLTKGTLSNWRHRDHMSGRIEAAPGFPRYRRWGRAVRYWLPLESDGGAVA